MAMFANCGVILDGKATIEQMGKVIFDETLRVASGKKKSELLGLGDHEFVPLNIGVVS
jgi:altronate hydrolase